MNRKEICRRAELELQAGNTIAEFVLDLDRALTRALLEAEATASRAKTLQSQVNALTGQRNDYEFMLARIAESLEGCRETGSHAQQIEKLRAKLDASLDDADFQIVGYTTQGDIDKTKVSAFTAGEFYAVPDSDTPVELLRRVKW